MATHSAGILLYRQGDDGYEVLLVHPGGPFWATKDEGSWSIPKGELDGEETPLTAAKREFQEEMGFAPPEGLYSELGESKQSSGKIVHAFTLEADANLERFKSDMFEMEWPPKSGKKQEFPENDKAAWVPLANARKKLVKGQVVFIDHLTERLDIDAKEDVPPATEVSDQPGQPSLF